MDTFIEQMGLIAQHDGGPRIAGQILGYLLVEGEPRTLSQMAQALKISKASASTNARMLEVKGAVRRVSPVGQRGDAYQVLDRPPAAVLETLAARFRTNADTIGALAADFPDSHAGARARVDDYAVFYRETADFFDEWLARLNPSCRDGAPPIPPAEAPAPDAAGRGKE
ncbi:MAG: transcriptional regulator [Maritimibacter sp.]|nr:transcriptional regulator [Maritimibacter sp.]